MKKILSLTLLGLLASCSSPAHRDFSLTRLIDHKEQSENHLWIGYDLGFYTFNNKNIFHYSREKIASNNIVDVNKNDIEKLNLLKSDKNSFIVKSMDQSFNINGPQIYIQNGMIISLNQYSTNVSEPLSSVKGDLIKYAPGSTPSFNKGIIEYKTDFHMSTSMDIKNSKNVLVFNNGNNSDNYHVFFLKLVND